MVAGRDAAAVNRVAAEMTSQAKRMPLIANVVSYAELDRPELRVVPIGDVAADLGVSTEAISEAVRIATIGDVGANLAKFDVGDRQVPIRVQLDEQRARDRQVLESLKVADRARRHRAALRGGALRAGQGPTAIDRYDRTRRVLVGADLVGNAPLGKAVDQHAGSCPRPRTCRPASSSSSSATPRSWARCSPASPPPWAPAS